MYLPIGNRSLCLYCLIYKPLLRAIHCKMEWKGIVKIFLIILISVLTPACARPCPWPDMWRLLGLQHVVLARKVYYFGLLLVKNSEVFLMSY